MSRSITIQLNEGSFSEIKRRAAADGLSPTAWLQSCLERQYGATLSEDSLSKDMGVESGQFESLIGSLHLESAQGTDNESIDEELAREYAVRLLTS